MSFHGDDGPCERLLWALLRDPMPMRGPAWLFEQKRVVDSVAAGTARGIERYIVCSGGALTKERTSQRLHDVVEEVRERGLDVTLIVAEAGVLAATRRLRNELIASLHAVGIILKDPSGELRPSWVTRAMADKAVEPALRRPAADAGINVDV